MYSWVTESLPSQSQSTSSVREQPDNQWYLSWISTSYCMSMVCSDQNSHSRAFALGVAQLRNTRNNGPALVGWMEKLHEGHVECGRAWISRNDKNLKESCSNTWTSSTLGYLKLRLIFQCSFCLEYPGDELSSRSLVWLAIWRWLSVEEIRGKHSPRFAWISNTSVAFPATDNTRRTAILSGVSSVQV